MNITKPTNIFSIIWLLLKGAVSHSKDKSKRLSDRSASFQLQLSSIIFLIGIAWVVCSTISSNIVSNISEPFQRSGSILVLVAIYLDYSFRESAIIKITLSISSPAESRKYCYFGFYLIKLAAIVRPFAILSAIIGTLIWGYGDEL